MRQSVGTPMTDKDERKEVAELLAAIKTAMPRLQVLAAECRSHWGPEDLIYRFYHQSFKVYGIQDLTLRILADLRALAPANQLNLAFLAIVDEGTGHHFASEHNRIWDIMTRPMLEAFFHARYFLDMVIKYGAMIQDPPRTLPSGWAAVLYLYGLR